VLWWPEGGGQWESSARLGEVNGLLLADVRTPYRSHREDKVTLSAQEYEEFLRLRRHAAYRK